jgi:hypothetical protein
MDYFTLYFNNTRLRLWYWLIENAFDTTLSELKFSISLFKLVAFFFLREDSRISVEGEMSTPRAMQYNLGNPGVR